MDEVTIVGAGPTGLMLAGELALARVAVSVLERRATPELVGTRARGFHARTLEIFDQRGIADRFLAEGEAVPAMSFAGTPLEVADLPTRHPYTLGISQAQVERLLRGWVEELGVVVEWSVEVSGFAQDDDGVDVHLAGGGSRRAAWLVGADGGRSVVRTSAGIDVVGPAATRSHLIAEAAVREEPPSGIRHDERGIHAINPTGDGRTVGIVVTEREVGPASEPTLAELSAALHDAYGTDFGVHDPSWVSRFTDATRQAVDYRQRRVLLAGDAVHTHPPTGGQGIGLGVEDAVNLGWKLAQVARGQSPEALLDTYRAERHPATARILDNVMTQAWLQRADARTLGVRATFGEVLGSREARLRLAALLAGLDVVLDLGEAHPLLGRVVPDLDVTTGDGATRVHALLREARPVLLDLDEAAHLDLGPWAGRVRHVRATCAGPWVLPVVGAVPAPAAALVRPDGHVAWVGDGTDAALMDALARWFGPAGAAVS